MGTKHYDANQDMKWVDVVFKNLIGGIMWGLGSLIGATFVLSILIGVLHKFDFIPFIADTVLQIQNVMEAKK